MRGGRRSADAATRGPARARPWEAFARGMDDFDALDSSHLTGFEALVASLSAVDRGDRLRLWEQITGDLR